MAVTVARTWVAALAAAGVMAGCSDSGSGDGSGGGPGVSEPPLVSGPPPTYAELSTEAEKLGEQVEDLYLTEPSNLPTSGSARYDGVIAIATDGVGGAPEDFAGELSLNVDFEDSNLSGQASNFVTVDEERLDGSLAITNGDLDRNTNPEFEPTYLFDMNGTLSDSDGDEFQVDAGGAGAFLGDDGEATFGFVVGGMSSEDGTADLEGIYLAN